MRPSAIITLTLVAFVLLLIAAVEGRRPRIEADLTGRTQVALQEAGLSDISVAAEGRDISLKGRLSSAAQERQALMIAQDIWGTRVVKNHLQIKLPPLSQASRPAPISPLTQITPPSPGACDSAPLALEESSGAIRFRRNSAQLTPKDQSTLRTLAQALKGCPDHPFQVEGHTDSWGKAKHNMSLSKRRAAAVVKELERLGVRQGPGTPKGYGETKPIASNRSAAGRSKNRRIEFKLAGS